MFHMFVLGQTGTGKSTLLANLIAQDISAGRGLCLIDPHGDLASSLVPKLGAADLYWEVADAASPYGYNPLTRASAAARPLIASGLIDALKKQWADAWGVRMEHLLRYAILALLEQPSADLTQIMRLYIDRPFRTQVLAQVSDPQVRHFWRIEYPAMNYKTAADGVAPIANKLGALLAHPIVRKALCEPAKPLRFRKLMDAQGRIIINLAKGRLGADMADVLGGLLIASIFNAALSRHDRPPVLRQPFHLYVDEFPSFSTLVFINMLSEIRKYAISVVLVNQFINQMDMALEQAVLGNTGTLIAFRLGATDAAAMAKEFDSDSPQALVNLPNYEAMVRLMIDGERSKAFHMRGFP